MNKGYVLFVIMNDAKRFKAVKGKLGELGYNRYTVMDTYGTTDVVDSLEFTSMLSGTISGQTNKKYNKTLYLLVQTETEVKDIMDALESVQNIDYKQPGKGIMFTIPIYASHGVRFEL